MSNQTTLHLKSKKQQGITLVELMVAMVIGLLLTAGIFQLFVSNKQTYRVTENMSRLQESGRFAMHFLTNDIRMADYWGCRGFDITIDNNLNASTIFDTYTTALEGTNDDNGSGDIITGTDTITIKGTFGSGVFLTSVPDVAAASFKVTDNSELEEGDIILLSDCSDGDLIQITNDPGVGGNVGFDNVVTSTGGTEVPGNADKVLRSTYDGTGAQVYKVNFTTYSIQEGAGGPSSLFSSTNGGAAQELVENIENMQILYGEDTDADGAANYYKPSDSVGLNMDNVVSVRISLVVVTLDNNVTEQANPYSLFDGAAITPTDRRIRRVFTSTIVIRNRLP
ncbi:MAG: PilW family protein [Cycloclasticus sp.]|nr:PilW family protein [Cycloclasticus sp.]